MITGVLLLLALLYYALGLSIIVKRQRKVMDELRRTLHDQRALNRELQGRLTALRLQQVNPPPVPGIGKLAPVRRKKP